MFPNPRQMSPSVISFLLQNGVADGLHRDSAPQIPVGASVDSEHGNAASCNSSKRPSELGSLKGYFNKGFHEHSRSDDFGSLPSTPEGELDGETEDVLENDTRQLLGRFLSDFTGLSKPRWTENKELSTMKRVVEDLLSRHSIAYNGMVKKLSLDKTKDDVTFVKKVAQSLFGDGTTNWGRIASLVAFGAVVSQYLKDTGRENCVELVGQEISEYLLTEQKDWLVQNNSWDGFVDFFQVTNPESSIRNTLMAVAGVAGIGATLALLIR
ncbi:induced myeloid leukemia cell differentiation protein Mcl-1b [Austrofundulus limnaeus]|uniref:Induced myeloid leukemia cell differentiation protein Mcl-1b n=1 Tax=Austrofundulus limnaeus TaxID=52670 RepID=A0A2I4BZJ0_AUSLI|nr:PREDICTED: induced myeloid leukemia cell differentiation protein Mcl-1-like [Austrofundulus limnaeus]